MVVEGTVASIVSLTKISYKLLINCPGYLLHFLQFYLEYRAARLLVEIRQMPSDKDKIREIS